MRLPLTLRPEAQSEFADAAIWYESQRGGLGDDFVSEVENAFDKITKQPDRYPVVHGYSRGTRLSISLLRLLSSQAASPGGDRGLSFSARSSNLAVTTV